MIGNGATADWRAPPKSDVGLLEAVEAWRSSEGRRVPGRAWP